MPRPVRILHAHSTFSLGGKEARAVRLMNAFGERAEHVILSSLPDQLSAREAIDPAIQVRLPADAPPLKGRPSLSRLFRLAGYMRQFDLVLSYNWGAFDAVMARYLFGRGEDFPPLIHHEDGFNEDEAAGLKKRRNLYRRLGLSAAYRLVVPSRRLEEIALNLWAQPSARVERIPNGIAVDRFAAAPESRSIPGLDDNPDEIVIGTVAGLRRVKNLPRLVRAVGAMAAEGVRLVIVGDGPERNAIVRELADHSLHTRTVMPGFLSEPWRFMGRFDIFALSSDSEQQPISLIEAMAAGLPAVCTDVGDVGEMVAEPNRPFIVDPNDESGFTAALERLRDPALRRAIGAANRVKARVEFNEATMIQRYGRLYGEAIGAPDGFVPFAA